MRYIRDSRSNGPLVDSSRRIGPGLSVTALAFASACVPTADLSSYSSAAANASADLGAHTALPPRPPQTTPSDKQDSSTATEPPPSTESNPGAGAVLDPGGASDPSNATAAGDDDPSATAGAASAPAAPAEPVEPSPADPDLPVPLSCTLEETTGPSGRCYVLVSTPLAWDGARANCQRRGSGWDLTSIRSAVDSSFVTSLLVDESWVGGTDAASEETWAWVDDGFEFWQGNGAEGEPLNGAFVNWFEDEPNGSTSSQCMRLLTDSRWADLECGELRRSLCEGPPR